MYLFSVYDRLASMHVFHAFIGPPRTGVADDFESAPTCWELNPGLARAARALTSQHHFSPHLTFETRSFTGLDVLHMPLAGWPESPWVLSLSTRVGSYRHALRRLTFLWLTYSHNSPVSHIQAKWRSTVWTCSASVQDSRPL